MDEVDTITNLVNEGIAACVKVVKDAEAVVEDSVVLAEDVAKDEANA